ncbi:hypothetical protein SAMN05421734_102469 [Pelagirhabdus alkalitolerans]|uniref:Uncharacterized protein n=1 Tax=Pelagirhabdus alkalitolerans TaxID=1612202 RepID=A0A1G6HCY7_9BACI|nr:hypothetical protein SAMN05421734_102469 [Pelagirhabdus alkalitolerans]
MMKGSILDYIKFLLVFLISFIIFSYGTLLYIDEYDQPLEEIRPFTIVEWVTK